MAASAACKSCPVLRNSRFPWRDCGYLGSPERVTNQAFPLIVCKVGFFGRLFFFKEGKEAEDKEAVGLETEIVERETKSVWCLWSTAEGGWYILCCGVGRSRWWGRKADEAPRGEGSTPLVFAVFPLVLSMTSTAVCF